MAGCVCADEDIVTAVLRVSICSYFGSAYFIYENRMVAVFPSFVFQDLVFQFSADINILVYVHVNDI
jgi:hypothetical protein